MHYFVPDYFDFVNENGEVSSYRLSNLYNKESLIKDYYDDMIRGFMHQPMNLGNFSDEMRNFLFRSSEITGMDLLAMDIQRGRDHGLPPYVDIVKYCSNLDIKDYHHLFGLISDEVFKTNF